MPSGGGKGYHESGSIDKLGDRCPLRNGRARLGSATMRKPHSTAFGRHGRPSGVLGRSLGNESRQATNTTVGSSNKISYQGLWRGSSIRRAPILKLVEPSRSSCSIVRMLGLDQWLCDQE